MKQALLHHHKGSISFTILKRLLPHGVVQNTTRLLFCRPVKCECQSDVVFLPTQPPSPPEDPAPSPPSKDKDSVASKKPSTKGKTAAGSQQVAMWQQAVRPACQTPVFSRCPLVVSFRGQELHQAFWPEARPGLTEVNKCTLLIFWLLTRKKCGFYCLDLKNYQPFELYFWIPNLQKEFKCVRHLHLRISPEVTEVWSTCHI